MHALTTLIQNNTRTFSQCNKKENKMHIKVRYKTFPFVDDVIFSTEKFQGIYKNIPGTKK